MRVPILVNMALQSPVGCRCICKTHIFFFYACKRYNHADDTAFNHLVIINMNTENGLNHLI